MRNEREATIMHFEEMAFITAPVVGGISNDAAIVAAMAGAVRQLAERITSAVQSLD
jgi:hypothetical protein